MKICELQLLAFGPFTQKTVDFSEGNFHIIFGPNEAGKSSALRGISSFLYEIHPQSTDNFLHEHKAMRLGATLENTDGKQATFIRRKGTKDTLLDSEGNPRADSEIEPFLGKVSKDLFLQMFGLSHQRLVKGGEDIVSGKGDAGVSIFSAGMGVIGLRRLLEELEKTAGGLFKPTGQKPEINRLISELKNAKKDQNTLLLTAKVYKEAASALEEVRVNRETRRKASADLANRLALLERLQKAAPKVMELGRVRRERDELGTVVLLADDFSERRRKTREERASTESDIKVFESDIAALQKNIATNSVDQSLLEMKSEISELFQRTGVFAKNQKDLPNLGHRRHLLREEAGLLLQKLGLPQEVDDAGKLRLTNPHKVRINAAADQLKSLKQQVFSTKKQVRDLQTKIGETEAGLKEMPTMRATESLQSAVKTAVGGGNLADQQESLKAEIRDIGSSVEGRFQRLLPKIVGQFEDLEKMPLPSTGTIKRFESEENALANDLKQTEVQIAESRSQREKLLLEIEAVIKGETVPSEERLTEVRARRDQGWSFVRLSWEGPKPDLQDIAAFSSGKPLADVYEEVVREADQTADELRRESSRVAQLQQLHAEQHRLDKKLEELENDRESHVAKQTEWLAHWHQVWDPLQISPLPPVDMLVWHQEVKELIVASQALRETKARLEGITKKMEHIRERLVEECAKVGSPVQETNFSFPELLSWVENRLEKIQQENESRQQAEWELAALTKSLKEEERNLTNFTENEQEARNNWGETVVPLGLSDSSEPEEAQAILSDIGEVFQKLDEAKSLEGRITGINKECGAFEKSVVVLLEKLGEVAEGAGPQEIVARLNQQLIESDKNLTLVETFRRGIEEKEQKAASARTRLESFFLRMKDLLKEAETDSEERLPEIEAASEKAREIERTIASLCEQLLDFCGGSTLEELIAKIEETDVDALPGEIQQLQEEKEELGRELSGLDEQVGSLRTKLDQLDGSPAAAIKAQEIEETKTALWMKVEEFTRARLASILLCREITRYKEKHQGPVLRRAGEIFAQLTLGSFSGLSTGYGEKDMQILLGVRTSGATVPVEGMSEGTCDQLYLALRLASLEHHLEKNEPMPLILDDILVNFDDERSRATLEVLAEISKKNQIIYFTHHRHILEIAAGLPIEVQTLGGESEVDGEKDEEMLTALV